MKRLLCSVQNVTVKLKKYYFTYILRTYLHHVFQKTGHHNRNNFFFLLNISLKIFHFQRANKNK